MSMCSAQGSGYMPSATVAAFHNIPHVDIDLNPSPENFELTLDYFEVSWQDRGRGAGRVRGKSCFDFRKKKRACTHKKPRYGLATPPWSSMAHTHLHTHLFTHTSKQAVIIWACVPILACVCLFILMSVYFICVCCGCCFGERKKRSNRPKIACGVLTSIMVVFCLWVQSFSPSIPIHLGACSWCTTRCLT